MNPDYNEFDTIPSDSPKLDYIMKGDGRETVPIAGVPPSPDPDYIPPAEGEEGGDEPIEEFVEQVPQHYDYVAEGGEMEPMPEDHPDTIGEEDDAQQIADTQGKRPVSV